jgi:hypothetical protein
MVVDEQAWRASSRRYGPIWMRQRRVVLGVEARETGHGGIAAIARAAKVPGLASAKRSKSSTGQMSVLHSDGRGVRVQDASRSLPAIRASSTLDALVDPDTRGDPQSPLRWTLKSTRQLADALTRVGHPVSHSTVGGLLRALGYSLQAGVKTREGCAHPDRDPQFRYMSTQARAHLNEDQPVISVDTKNKSYSETVRAVGGNGSPKASRSKQASTTSLILIR